MTSIFLNFAFNYHVYNKSLIFAFFFLLIFLIYLMDFFLASDFFGEVLWVPVELNGNIFTIIHVKFILFLAADYPQRNAVSKAAIEINFIWNWSVSFLFNG